MTVEEAERFNPVRFRVWPIDKTTGRAVEWKSLGVVNLDNRFIRGDNLRRLLYPYSAYTLETGLPPGDARAFFIRWCRMNLNYKWTLKDANFTKDRGTLFFFFMWWWFDNGVIKLGLT